VMMMRRKCGILAPTLDAFRSLEGLQDASVSEPPET
jgi:hypothetical protein